MKTVSVGCESCGRPIGSQHSADCVYSGDVIPISGPYPILPGPEELPSGYVEEMLAGYVECALWASTDQADETGGRPLDDNYGPEDLSEEAHKSMAEDVSAFARSEARDLLLSDLSAGRAGFLFWLNRNGHGSGFWDEGLFEVGERLSRASKVYGSSDLYIGDDGALYVS